MTVRHVGFDGGVAGAVPPASLPPLEDGQGSRVYLTPGLHGSSSALRLPGDAPARYQVDVRGLRAWTLRWYERFGSGAPANHVFLAYVNDPNNAYLGDLQLRNVGGGTLYNRFNYATTTGSYLSSPEPRNVWCRYEYTWVEGQYVEARVWRGSRMDEAAAPDATLNRDLRGVSASTAAGFVFLGANAVSGYVLDIDSAAFSDTVDSPGPYTSQASAPAPTPAPASPTAKWSVLVDGVERPLTSWQRVP